LFVRKTAKNKAISRRAFFSGAAVLALASRNAFALPRLPVGGKIAMRLPWSLGSIDPHRLDDGAAAVFSSALFDSLYVLDAAGNPIPALAETLPETDGAGGLRIKMRDGLITAHGSVIDARDAVLALARCRSHGAGAWLAALPTPKREGEKAFTFAFDDPQALARLLASPLTAIVPLAFDPNRPDGTGPFRADRKDGALVLSRNARAANGPAILDEIRVLTAADLADSLRAFESGTDDIGYLGTGLHEPRAGSKTFDAGPFGWALLVVGRDGGNWDAPGIAQRVADGIAPSRLSYLALGPAWPQSGVQSWSGSPIDLLVADDAPWLVELARAVAATISQPSHEVTVRPISAADFASKRRSRNFALAVDVTRSFAPGAFPAMVSLASSDPSSSAAELVRHPPKIAEVSARALTRTLRVGVLGEARIQGGRMPDLSLPLRAGGIDWGTASRARKHA
jgi:peptide/nickel transport system substrate-binding protein